MLQRRVEPAFAVWNAAGAQTADQLRTYYAEYVEPEIERVVQLGYDEVAIRAQELRFRNALAGFQRHTVQFASVSQALDDLGAAVNQGADAAENTTLGAHQAFLGHHPRQHAWETAEDTWRGHRKVREGIMVPAGTRHRRPIRGFRSAAEADNVITGLRNGLVAAGVGDAQVAARGSAVRGTNRDRTREYRPGTGNDAMSNDASDIDFFFFSPTLEQAISAEDRPGDPMWRGGNNVHPDKLEQLLTAATYGAFQQRLGHRGINVVQLLQVLRTFPTQTKNTIGRKSDVTLLRLVELGNFAPEEYVLV
jgi:hypothetical protein